ncbi:hypothetical protein L292_3166 [Acinetobacter junii CIP 107470 = MTCC 11364]|uniref:Uncharacterized protein n=1 Tax=Acinetobacter junii CIP 107470 = MTCC 11364 TaxID=1217666 RepID=S7WRN2_ACIJU|nr:hypothetical protein [Acinetobacter junii]ENV52037.1 hypothetical protein F953_00527 [Acinetobacter junii CIP 107470 = MTCC 11364]EPR85836.1 hypothetical protein L292_3166 [Acinetobacter junii CIP 107470 = MTCC 11364]
MTTIDDKNPKADEDIFNENVEQVASEESTENQETGQSDVETSEKKKGFEPKFWHIALIGIIGAVIWIFYPNFMGSPKPAQQGQQTASNSTNVLKPNDAMLNASNGGQPNQNQAQAPVTGSTNSLMEQAASNANPQQAAPIGNSPYTPEQQAAINNNIQNINQALAQAEASGDTVAQRDAYHAAYNLSLQQQQILTNKINALEQQIITERQNQRVKVEKAAQPKTPKQKTDAEILAREKLPAVKVYKGKVLGEYHINTIYAENAFIEHENETYSVKEGDSLFGKKILKIDAISHVVVTSGGLIK